MQCNRPIGYKFSYTIRNSRCNASFIPTNRRGQTNQDGKQTWSRTSLDCGAQHMGDYLKNQGRFSFLITPLRPYQTLPGQAQHGIDMV